MPETLYLHWIGEDGRAARHFGPFEAAEGLELRIGRQEGSDLRLEDKSVSRLHAVLRFEKGAWSFEDLGSRFGSELDGGSLESPVEVRVGSRLRLGRVRLLIANAPPETEGDSGDGERRYEVLLQVLETLGGDRSQGELLQRVIEIAGRAVEADRGFILLTDSDTGRWLPESLAVWCREGEEDFAEDAIGRASQTVLRDALEGGRTVFLKFAADDPRYEGAESIRVESIQTILCCPLLLDERSAGAFYLDRTHGGGRPFTEGDHVLLETVAAQAARVIEKERLITQRARDEKLTLLGTLLGRVTHELKNPLYNIRGTTENLLAKLSAGEMPEDVSSRLERILAGVDRAEANMKSLLAFSRPAEGPREPVDLARALTAAAVDAAPLFAERGVELKRDYSRGPRVLGRSDALQQLFANLLVNAAQALEGGGEVSLLARTSARLGAGEDNWIEILVEDDGPGIPPENLPRLFEDFFTTKRGSGGSGLGLAICRQIAEEHGGAIRAENREEGGARFVLGLPIHDQAKETR